MGRKRRKTSSSSKKTNTKAKAFDIDLIVILLVILGILSFVVIYGKSGTVGEMLSPALGGCLGGIKYLIPFGIFATAFVVGRDEGRFIKSKLIQVILLLGFIASVLTIYQISIQNIDKTKGFETVVQAGYTLGINNKGGGTIGAVIAYPLVMLFSEFGAAVVSLGGTAFLFVFTFGLKPSQMLSNLSERLEESREIRREEDEEREHRREERRNSRRKVADISIDDEDELSQKEGKRKRSRVPNLIDDDMLENSDLSEEQIKINLNDEEQNVSPKGRIKGILRKSDKTAEIVENNHSEKPNPNELTDLFREQEVVKENKTQSVLQLEHNTTSENDENYEFPPFELMKQGVSKNGKGGKRALTETAARLQKTLYSFGVSAKVENVSVGPAITRYELKPAEGVRVSKIAKLSDDIALNLAAESIRIEAPIPGKQAVGIEIPNTEKEMVPLRDVLETDAFQYANSKLSMGLGKDIAGEAVIADIGKMPHVLIAGSTGSRKISVY